MIMDNLDQKTIKQIEKVLSKILYKGKERCSIINISLSNYDNAYYNPLKKNSLKLIVAFRKRTIETYILLLHKYSVTETKATTIVTIRGKVLRSKKLRKVEYSMYRAYAVDCKDNFPFMWNFKPSEVYYINQLLKRYEKGENC